MKPYPLQLEICGPTAMWTRPDTGSSPVSCVAPTLQHPLRLGRGDSLLRTGEKVSEGRMRCGAQIVRQHRVRCRIQTNSAVPDYVGPFRPETCVCETENHELPTMPRMVFDLTLNSSTN